LTPEQVAPEAVAGTLVILQLLVQLVKEMPGELVLLKAMEELLEEAGELVLLEATDLRNIWVQILVDLVVQG
jgi:hypothetical protein